MDFSEKRTYMRMQTNTPAKLTQQATLTTIDCICLDLTAKGMLIETANQLPVGLQLIINIPPSSKNFSELKALITVVRCDLSLDGRFFSGSKIEKIIPVNPLLKI